MQGKIGTIFAAGNPMGDYEELEGFFSQWFPPPRSGLMSSISHCIHTHRRWEHRQPRLSHGSRRQGGQPVTIVRGPPR